MTNPPPQRPHLAAAAVMRRDDGKVLLFQHGDTGPFAGRWSLPITVVADEETAEDAIERVLREHTHVEPGPVEFEDTLYINGDGGTRFIVNAFLCRGWHGEPQYSRQHYADAAWSLPASPAVSGELLPEIRIWLLETMGEPAHPRTPDTIAEQLDETRGTLLAAFQAIPARAREEALQDGWSPLDVLVHAAEVEAYYLAETDRLMRTPGHIWRGFNDAQWYDLHRLREPSDAASAQLRLYEVRERTRFWLASVSEDQLAQYGNHHERGAVLIGERVERIAHHEHEHAEQILAMGDVARARTNTADTTADGA
jgi:ADP-ribose pyrophosphatase YjhB (NUDIX family)